MAENRLDKAIADVAYILDCLMAFRRIAETGCCNDCKKKPICQWAPPIGATVRYNCYFYEKAQHESEGNND